ncbi:MAG: YbhN family protein [Rubrobacteraceae bacterium]
MCSTREKRPRKILRNVLYVLSIGLAVHLVLPQIPGLERSMRLIAEAAPFLILAAFVAELSSVSCYAELMGRSVGSAAGLGASMRARKRGGLGRWFMLRLAISETGASHVLPGGGASMAAVTYGALRARGFEPGRIGVALAVVSALVYGSLGIIFAGSLAYMLLSRDLGATGLISALIGLAVTLAAFAGSYAAYRRPQLARRILVRIIRTIGRILRRGWSEEEAASISRKVVASIGDELRATRRQLLGRPGEILKLGALAFGYWIFDFLCLFLVFEALSVPAGILELLVAYGIATAVGQLPLTPGGIGVFETTVLATLALLGVGAAAAIPILGYRLFNFWLPIPLAGVFYPTLRLGSRRYTREPDI